MKEQYITQDMKLAAYIRLVRPELYVGARRLNELQSVFLFDDIPECIFLAREFKASEFFKYVDCYFECKADHENAKITT